VIDLHCHSTASDGVLAPEAVVERAAERGLAGVALTDHDTLAGLAAARARAAALGLRFLAGIELSTNWGGQCDVHVLGYGVREHPGGELADLCRGLRQDRCERAARMVSQLRAAGVAIELGAVRAQAGEAALGRPHLARALIAGGWARDGAEAFARWLVPGAPGYVAHATLETRAAVRRLRAAGAAAVLAHPARIAIGEHELEPLVAALAGDGLAGIEAFWSQHSEADVERSLRLAARYGLLATGGSDFHGGEPAGVDLGACAGGRALPLELMDQLEHAIAGGAAGAFSGQ
jgi:predicted metal-dependent phosphoesterase TrpH